MENIDSFPFSGITESNLSTIYAEYDNFSVDSSVDMNLLSDIVNGVFISGDYSYNFEGKTVTFTADLDLQDRAVSFP
jgi:hypothetical protein